MRSVGPGDAQQTNKSNTVGYHIYIRDRSLMLFMYNPRSYMRDRGSYIRDPKPRRFRTHCMCIHRCTRMTLRRMTLTCRPITTRQTLLLSMILPLHRRCPLLHWPTSLALTPPHPAVPALAACPRSPHRSASVVGSRTRTTTRHETAAVSPVKPKPPNHIKVLVDPIAMHNPGSY